MMENMGLQKFPDNIHRSLSCFRVKKVSNLGLSRSQAKETFGVRVYFRGQLSAA